MSFLYHILSKGAARLTKEELHSIIFKLMIHRLCHICINLSLYAFQPEHTSGLGPFTITPQSFINTKIIGIERPTLTLRIVVILDIQLTTSLN